MNEPKKCNIILLPIECGTATIDRTTALMGEFVTVTVEPNPAYENGYMQYYNSYDELNYYKDSNNPNVFHIFVSESTMKIYYWAYKKPTNNIISVFEDNPYSYSKEKYLKGNILIDGDSNKSSTYEGKTVTFTVVPEAQYYCPKENIKVYYYEDNKEKTIELTEDKEENTYSFIMPKLDSHSNVSINVDFIYNLNFTPNQNTYIEGDKLTYKVENHSKNTVCDLYIIYGSEDIKTELLQSNFDLTKEIIEIDSTKHGVGAFYLYPKITDSTEYYKLDNKILIKQKDLPEDWNPVGLYLDSEKTDKVSKRIYSKINNASNATLKLKYYLKSDPSNIKSTSLDNYNAAGYCKFNLVYDNKDTAVIWIEDDNKKLKSNSIEFEIPIYETVEYEREKTIYNSNSLIDVTDTNWNDVKIQIEEGADDYFTCEKTENYSYRYITITPKKPTKIPREIQLISKSVSNKVYKKLYVTIDYSGIITVKKTKD